VNVNNIIISISSLILLIALASGCLEYTVTTRIMPDGSIERIILVEGDSSSIFHGSLPVPSDSTWEITFGHRDKTAADSSSGNTFFYKARKVYRNYHDLNKEINADSTSNGKIKRFVKVEKRFRWFYTFYRYSETYNKIFPFGRHPVSEFLNDEELEIVHAADDELYYSSEFDKLILKKDTLSGPLLSHKDSIRMHELKKGIEKKYNNWIKINLYDDFYDVLKEALINTGKFNLLQIDKNREVFFAYLDTSINKLDDFYTILDSSSTILLQLSSAYYNMDILKLREANKTGFDKFYSKQSKTLIGFDDSYTNNAVMPGVVIATNSTIINGNIATWKLEAGNFFEKDYTLWVESRKINKGIIFLTGAIALFLLTGLLIGIFRK
jgi:hypothetical protein